jgi:hypothetical protein
MNRNKEIWEGWTVGDFIEELEPIFETVLRFHGFDSPKAVKDWVKSEQPYYKKEIPEVASYFIKKYEENI